MKRIVLFVLMLVSVAAISQPANYLNIRSRYNLIAVKTDSGFHVPGYSTIPNYRGGVWSGAGNIGVDTVNNKFYFYSGGAWREAGNTNYADSLRRSGLAVQMRKNGNWTTQFDLPDSGGATPTLQQVLTAGSTLTVDNTINVNDHIFNIDSSNSFSLTTKSKSVDDVISRKSIYVINSDDSGLDGLFFETKNNQYPLINRATIRMISGDIHYNATSSHSFTGDFLVNPNSGNFKINTLNNTLSTTGKKILIRDTATGLVQNIDPALLGGGGGPDTSYTTLASFTAGGGFASDTTMCTDSTLFGSFYTGQFNYTIAYIQAVIKGNAGDSIVLKLVYNDTFNVDGTKVNGAGLSVNNRYTGNQIQITTNRTVPANTWLWLKPEAVITGKKPKYISVTLVGYKTYVTP